MQRRDFLKSTLAGSLAAGSATPHARAEEKPAGPLPKRALGKTGEQLSIIGLGGIVVRSLEERPQQEANDHVARAIDCGVNYFDVAPSYGDAEARLGPALEPYRNKVFLACKTGQRDAAGAARELENSLKVLRTDHFDTYQLHGLQNLDDAKKAFAPGGALETFIKAKEQGKTRFLGFSAHSVAAALWAMDQYAFDTILFPINYVLCLKENFGPQVIERAREKGLGILALKAIARTPTTKDNKPFAKCWYVPETEPDWQELAARFTLSQPITATVPPGDETLFWRVVEVASRFRPIQPAEVDRLKARAQDTQPIMRLDT